MSQSLVVMVGFLSSESFIFDLCFVGPRIPHKCLIVNKHNQLRSFAGGQRTAMVDEAQNRFYSWPFGSVPRPTNDHRSLSSDHDCDRGGWGDLIRDPFPTHRNHVMPYVNSLESRSCEEVVQRSKRRSRD